MQFDKGTYNCKEGASQEVSKSTHRCKGIRFVCVAGFLTSGQRAAKISFK